MALETLFQDMRYAVRTLRKSPGFACVAVLALALGIGANSAVFSVVNGVLLKPPPFREPDRLVHLSLDMKAVDLKDISVSVPESRDFARLSRAFASVAAFYTDDVTLTGGDTPVRFSTVSATASFLPTLGVTPVLGRNFTEDEETQGRHRVVVLSHRAWRTQFAMDPQVLGRSLQLDGEPYAVVGVLPEGVEYPSKTDLYLPFAPSAEQVQESHRGNRYLSVLARMKPGVTLAAAQADVARMQSEMVVEHARYKDAGWSINMKSLEDAVVGDVRGTLWMLLGAVGFVLLVACSSVANLLLARAAARGREVSIRAALGAGRNRLVAQFLTESLVLSLAGGALGLLFALWGTDVLVGIVGEGLPRAAEVRLDVASVLFTAGVSVLTGVLFGLAPALQASRADLSATMREGSRSTEGGRGRLRSGLVVAQVALALVLLVGAGLFVKSFLALSSVDAGFEPEGVFTGRVALPAVTYPGGPRQVAFQRDLLARLASLPGVESVGLTNLLPLGSRSDRSFDVEGRTLTPEDHLPAVEYRSVTPGYLRALRFHLRDGRLLEESDGPEAPWAVVINTSFASTYWPKGDALGKRIKLHGKDTQWTTVVGIVDDVREWGLDVSTRPAAYYAMAQMPSANVSLAVRARSGNPESLRASVEAEVRAVDANLPLFDVAPLTRVVDDSIGSRRLSALLMGLFAATALLLAALGLSGVIAYSVAQRTREMGIRMALGAARGDVLALVLGQGMRLAVVGVAVGLALSLVLARLLGTLLYGVTAYDPWTFLGVATLLCGVALVATWLPARRATRVDPIIALRSE